MARGGSLQIALDSRTWNCRCPADWNTVIVQSAGTELGEREPPVRYSARASFYSTCECPVPMTVTADLPGLAAAGGGR